MGDLSKMKRAMVFPGQGSQAVGMGCELALAFPAAQRLFDEVDEALSQPLSRLMFAGPESELTLTENAQPALMAASLAVIRVLEAEAGLDLGRDVAYVAGHSLGEYSALAAAGALSVGDAARLLRLRGRAMQRAVPVGEGAMAALIGFDAAAAHAVAAAATPGSIATRFAPWPTTMRRGRSCSAAIAAPSSAPSRSPASAARAAGSCWRSARRFTRRCWHRPRRRWPKRWRT
jgi:[acyl-carrier-protein] S-malonyltransferase